jgi:hypothetical protein
VRVCRNVVLKGKMFGSYLTIGKDTSLETFQNIGNDGAQSDGKDILLIRKGCEDIVKRELRTSLFGTDALDDGHRLVGGRRGNHRQSPFLGFLAIHGSQPNDNLNRRHVV